jgi:hypothetical protein
MEAKDLDAALWPIAVVQDRYCGTYIGGKWVAIPHASGVDYESGLWGSDEDAMFWAKRKENTYGTGDTPDAALADLYEKVLEFGLKIEHDPYERIEVLENAIRLHKEMVLQDPSRTEEAEDMLWDLVEDYSDSDQG